MDCLCQVNGLVSPHEPSHVAAMFMKDNMFNLSRIVLIYYNATITAAYEA